MRTKWLATLALFAGLGLIASLAMAQSQTQGQGEQQFKQVKLTEKKVQGFIAAQKQLAPLSSKLGAPPTRPINIRNMTAIRVMPGICETCRDSRQDLKILI